MSIFFSICMPVYNVENYIETSIESVIEQTFSNWELIIVNDGTKDKSGIIADKYAQKDNRIMVIHKKNEGLLSARREAIKHIRGEYAIFLDSDDYLENNALSEIYSVLSQNDVDILIYGANSFSETKNNPMRYCLPEGIVDKKLLFNIFISNHLLNSIWTKAIKSSIVRNDPTDYSCYYNNSYGEDKLQLMYPFTVAENVYSLNKRLYNYRINDSSMTHIYSVESIEKRLHMHIWKELRKYMDIWGLNDEGCLKSFSHYYIRQIIQVFDMTYYYSNDRNRCVKYNWKKYFTDEIMKYFLDNEISLTAKVKIYCMIHNTDIPIKIYHWLRGGN